MEPYWLDLVVRPLPVRNLPLALNGQTLAQISDVHVGPRVDNGYVRSVFERVAVLRPDIVVLTGDLVSYHDRVFEQMDAVYRHFPRGRLATVGIPGNHDYGPGWSHPEMQIRSSRSPNGTASRCCAIASARSKGCRSSGSTISGRNVSIRRRPSLITTIDARDCAQPQSRYGRLAGVGTIRGLDSLGPHPWRTMQASVSPATAAPGSQPALHAGRVQLERQQVHVHQSWRRSPVVRPLQRSARGDAVQAPPGVKAGARFPSSLRPRS